jgi:nitrate reductase gamma subunit
MTELRYILAVALPYAGLLAFLLGIACRVVRWAQAPVPFRIPTTCGQQKSLPWIQPAWLESPHTTAGAVARVACEVLLFRSLLRDERPDRQGMRLTSAPAPWLWLAALAFHWTLLLVLLRHLRLFLEPVPQALVWLQGLDGFFQAGTPVVYFSDVLLLGALCFLLARRLALAQIRYLSLPADYIALGLLLAVAGSGVWLRYFGRIDIAGVKRYGLGLATFAPAPPAEAGAMFYAHVAIVSLLLAYFPFSKLVHMGGIFLSPTRNLVNNSRAVRHINPWNPVVEVHTYEQWEDEFRAKMKAAGLPVERP